MGFEAEQSTLQSVAGSLSSAADNLAAGAGEPPGEVRAGAVSGVLMALAANMAKETETYTGQLAGAAETVLSSSEDYLEVDEGARQTMRPPEERPDPPPPTGGDDSPPQVQGPTV